MTNNPHCLCIVDRPLTEVFPQLHTLIIYDAYLVDDDDLVPFLCLFRQLRSVSFHRCQLQSKSHLISRYLLLNNDQDQLTHSRFHTFSGDDGFVFLYPLPSSYQVQSSLRHLRIDMFDLQSLINLLHFLPQLVTLGES